MKKIAFLIKNLEAGGAERTVSYLANFGVENNFDISIILYGDRGFYNIDKKVKIFVAQNKHDNSRLFKRIKCFFKRKKEIKRIVTKEKIDIVVCLLYPSLLLTSGLPKHVKVFGSERSNPKFLKNPFKKLIKYYFFKKCDGIIFQTKRVEKYYSFLKLKNSTVISNAVGDNYSSQLKGPSGIVEKTICSVGSLKPEKDFKTLIFGFSLFYENHKDFKLKIFGDGPLKNELLTFITELHLEECVSLCGLSHNITKDIYKSFAYAQTSISEGMPNSLIEAMSVGLACVSTNCDFGPSELITDMNNGLLIPVGDSIALSNALELFFVNRTLWNRCRDEAFKINETNSISKKAKEYFDFITK